MTAANPHHALAIDFYTDHPVDGPGFKIASIIEERTRLVLDNTLDVSITGEELVGSLERLSITHGLPVILRMDNGPEMTCRAIAELVHDAVALAFIPPGEPLKNGYVKSFHTHQRDECLNISTFPSLLRARVELTDWHHAYNHVSRHSSLSFETPAEYAEHCTCTKLDCLPIRPDLIPWNEKSGSCQCHSPMQESRALEWLDFVDQWQSPLMIALVKSFPSGSGV